MRGGVCRSSLLLPYHSYVSLWYDTRAKEKEKYKLGSKEIRDGQRTVILLDKVSWMAHFDRMFSGTLKIAWDNYLKPHDNLVFDGELVRSAEADVFLMQSCRFVLCSKSPE